MINRYILKQIALFASKLDSIGLYKYADMVDNILISASDDEYEPIYWSKEYPARPIAEIEDDIRKMHASINRAKTFPTANLFDPDEAEIAGNSIAPGETILDTNYVPTLESTLEDLKQELAWAKTQPVDLNSEREYREYRKRFKEQVNTIIKLLETKRTVVLVVEEYGYRYWLWLPGVSGRELEMWWKSQDKVEPNIHSLGEVTELVSSDVMHEITDVYNVYIAHIDEDEGTRLERPNGNVIRTKGYMDRKETT